MERKFSDRLSEVQLLCPFLGTKCHKYLQNHCTFKSLCIRKRNLLKCLGDVTDNCGLWWYHKPRLMGNHGVSNHYYHIS